MELRFPLILDGAMGTELQKRGFDGGDCAERWTLDHPEALLEIQRGYVAAGSRILYTPTFGANRTKLEAHGIFNLTAKLSSRATCRRRGCSSIPWATRALRSWWRFTRSRPKRWKRPGSTSL